MMAAAELLGIAQDLLWHGFLILLRVGPVMALMPAFSEQSVPPRVKLILALAFTIVVAPAVPPFYAGPPGDISDLILYSATETISGLAIGFGVRMFVLALQTAGAIAAQSTSLSQLLGGAASEPLPAMGHVLLISGLALAMMTGLHIRMAQLLILSYEILPAGQFPDARILAAWGTGNVAKAFALAFTLAAPFVILSVLYNLTLGVINRAMPQLMVAFVGAPVITAGGLLMLMLMSPLMLAVWIDAMNAFLDNPFGGAP
jgi:flagellar biosynthetic protein FliR